MTLPLSRQAILTGLLITVLPMLGDYYTNQMLSGAASTSMIGNLIQGQLGTPGLEGQGAVLSLMLLLVLLVPMIYYVIATNREARRRDDRDQGPRRRRRRARRPRRRAPRHRRTRPRPRPSWRNPWRHPWFLEGFTWLYLIWSLVPIVIAVLFSFNNGRSQSAWQGFSWRWYFTDPVNSVLHNPQLHAAVIQTVRLSVLTTLIAVPLGVAFALGINRWRGPVPATFNFVMILSYVIPELIFGVSMFFVFTTLFSTVHLGTLAEVLGLVTWNVSWPAIVVQARLVTHRPPVRGGRRRPGREPVPGDAPGHGPAARPGHLRQRRAGLLRRDRRLRDRRPALLERGQHPDVGDHLLDTARRQRRPRAERPRLHHAGDVAGHRVIGYIGYRLLTSGERGGGLAALTAIAGEKADPPAVSFLSRTDLARAPALAEEPTGGRRVLEDLEFDDAGSPAIGLVPPGVSWQEVRDHIKIAHHHLLIPPADGAGYIGAYWTGTEMAVVEDLGPDAEEAIDEFRAYLQEHEMWILVPAPVSSCPARASAARSRPTSTWASGRGSTRPSA